MLVVGHRADGSKEYKIIRDYHSEYKKKEGVFFVLTNNEGTQTFSKFLPKEQMNNNYVWEKVKNSDVDYTSAGIEYGQESKLIVETGFIDVRKKVTGDRTYTYRKFRFILNERTNGVDLTSFYE